MELASLGVEKVLFKSKQQFITRAACSACRRLDHLSALSTHEKSRRSQDHIKAVSKPGGRVDDILTRKERSGRRAAQEG
jgi:hypothetical protein